MFVKASLAAGKIKIRQCYAATRNYADAGYYTACDPNLDGVRGWPVVGLARIDDLSCFGLGLAHDEVCC